VIPIERIDDALLARLGDDLLKPAIIDAVIAGVTAALKPRGEQVSKRRSELMTVKQEIARLTEAIATSTSTLPSLLKALQARQHRHDELVALEAAQPYTARQVDPRAIETAVRTKLDAWRSLLTRQTADGRELLRQVLDAPLRFTPEGTEYRIDGTAALGKLLVGSVPTDLASLRRSGDLLRRRGRLPKAA
jgi:hypothetical protein